MKLRSQFTFLLLLLFYHLKLWNFHFSSKYFSIKKYEKIRNIAATSALLIQLMCTQKATLLVQ